MYSITRPGTPSTSMMSVTETMLGCRSVLWIRPSWRSRSMTLRVGTRRTLSACIEPSRVFWTR